MPEPLAVHSAFCRPRSDSPLPVLPPALDRPLARLIPGKTPAAAAAASLRALPLAGLLAALAAGCSAPLPYTGRDPALAAARADFAARRLDSADLTRFLDSAGARLPAAGSGWDFDALALVAGWYSAEVAVAQARWQGVLERQRQGWTPPPVPLDVALEHHSVTDASRPQPWTLALGFEITLPSARRQAARQAQLDSAVELARIELAQAFWAARERVRASWQTLLDLQARQPWLERQGELCREREQRVGIRLAHGEAAASEVQSAARATLQAQAALEALRRERATAQARLRVALGLPAEGADLILAPPEAALDTASAAEPALTERAALDNRLDLRAAEARFQQADADLRWEVAQQYPELGLKPGYEWDQGDHRLRIGLSLPLALPTAHRAQVGQALAEREARARELLGRQEAVLQEVALAQRSLADEQAGRRAQSLQLVALQAAAASVARGQQLGEFDPLQRVEAELAVALQAQQLQAAEARLARAREDLENVLQRPLGTLLAPAAAAGGRTGSAPGTREPDS